MKMIHNIAPHKLDNSFKITPDPSGGLAVLFQESKVLLEIRGEQLCIPSYDKIAEKYGVARQQFLCSLDQQDLFLVELTKMYLDASYDFFPIRSLRRDQRLSKEQRFALMTAWHLYTWYHNNQYCGTCQTPLEYHKTMRALVCPNCKREIFPSIAPAVIIGVVDGDRILLSKYAGRPYTGYALLAGFTEIGETPEETVAREVMEEVGLRVKNIRYYKSQPGGIDSNLLLGFFCQLDGSNQITRDTEELAMANWFQREEIPVEDDNYSLTFEMIALFKNHPDLFQTE